MIEDGKANFLYYSPDKMLNGSMLFSHYVEYMFKLKKDNPSLKFAKRILNILWGALCETKTSGKYTLKYEEDATITLNENEEIAYVKRYDNGTRILECETVGDRFYSGFSRIGPFLTSHGRKMIGLLALEHVTNLDSIQRIYTDCILSSEPLNLTEKSLCELGEFGLEHSKKYVEVQNAISVVYK